MLYAGKTHSKWMSLLHKNSNVSNVTTCPQQGVCVTHSPLLFIHKHVNRSPSSSSAALSPHDKPSTQGREGMVVGATYKEHIKELQYEGNHFLLSPGSGTCKTVSGCFVRSAVTPVNASCSLEQRLKNHHPSSFCATSPSTAS